MNKAVSAFKAAFSKPNPVTERDAATDIVTREQWSKHGRWHRADGPAGIWRDAATDIVTCEQWRKGDKKDRADGPAGIWRNRETGEVTSLEWNKDGKRFEPTAEVYAAWLQKSGERIAPPAPIPQLNSKLLRTLPWAHCKRLFLR